MPRLPRRVTWIAVLLAAVLALLFWRSRAAMTVRLHHAVPHALEVAASVVGFPDEVRYFPRDPGDIKLMTKEFVDSWEREKGYLHRQDLPPNVLSRHLRDPAYMRQPYEFGFAQASAGYRWAKQPPTQVGEYEDEDEASP